MLWKIKQVKYLSSNTYQWILCLYRHDNGKLSFILFNLQTNSELICLTCDPHTRLKMDQHTVVNRRSQTSLGYESQNLNPPPHLPHPPPPPHLPQPPHPTYPHPPPTPQPTPHPPPSPTPSPPPIIVFETVNTFQGGVQWEQVQSCILDEGTRTHISQVFICPCPTCIFPCLFLDLHSVGQTNLSAPWDWINIHSP